MLYLWKGTRASRTGVEVARRLNARRIRGHNSRYRPRPSHQVINWGTSHCPFENRVHMIQPPMAVARASHKFTALICMDEAGINVPEYTRDPEIALRWNAPFIARSRMNGYGGIDAVYIDPSQGETCLAGFVLFTKYVKKYREYRVHVVGDKVIDIQQKRKRNGFDNADFRIRNHSRGWVFCRENVDNPNSDIEDPAINAVASLGLDYGAVDILDSTYDGAVVIEVNTAPGLENTTLDNYVSALSSLVNHG